MNRFPLSYNEIDVDGLISVLNAYKGRDHQEIIHDLERQLSDLVGCPNIAAVQSGTSALHLALQCVGVKPGDYVIAPTFAYVASVSPIAYLGAHPVLVDCEELTWNIDPALVEVALKKLSSEGRRIGAVIVVHNYGVPAGMDKLLSLSKQYNVPLVEDAAESFGSKVNDKWTGTLGDVGVFSFNNNKTITGFGGGAVVSSSRAIIDRARFLGSHARSEVPYYHHEEVGYNYRMSPLTAACVLSQLKRLPELFKHRSEIAEAYHIAGSRIGLSFQKPDNELHVQPWIPACILQNGVSPDALLNRLSSRGYEGRRLWNPLHSQPAFYGSIVFGGTVAERLFHQGICLPVGSISNRGSDGHQSEIQDILDLIAKG